MYEELMTCEEAVSAYDLGPMFAVTQPFNKEKYDIEYQDKTKAKQRGYTSEDQTPITKQEILELIQAAGVIYDRRRT
jgi:hypothetical protein